MSDRLFELDDIAQTLRVTPLSELASQVSETEDNYLSLRAQGLSDLAIVDKYVDFPRDTWDLEAMYTSDDTTSSPVSLFMISWTFFNSGTETFVSADAARANAVSISTTFTTFASSEILFFRG